MKNLIHNVVKKELHQNKLHESSSDTPKIGLFWLHLKDGKVKIYYSSPITLASGQNYGSFIIDPSGHYDTWESLVQDGIAPINSNYEDLPRGRIAYDKRKDQYVVYHGNYLKSSYGIKPVIKAEFKLKHNIRWEPDLHYHRFKRWGF